MPTDFESLVAERTRHALASGALLSLSSECRHVEANGIRFAVHILGNLPAKSAAVRAQPPDFNPFHPWDPDLFVCDLSETHVCILNKFNVVDHHVLMVTRAFEEQESLLTLADMESLSFCLEGMDGVGFYNSGRVAGASQRHKHLQVAPVAEIPVEKAIAEAEPGPAGFEHLPLFPFPHLLLRNPDLSPAALLATYQSMLKLLALDEEPTPRPYNLLVTGRWFLVVPRKEERCEQIAINALGFTGNFLARNEERLQRIIRLGPVEILRRVVTG